MYDDIKNLNIYYKTAKPTLKCQRHIKIIQISDDFLQ